MKLRNKNTGKVLRVGEDVYIRSLDSGSIEVREDFGCGNKIEYFKTFAEMFNRYEEIKEPLIKDERIRKAVKAWAEAIVDDCLHIVNDYRIDNTSGYSIEFYNDPFENLEKRYYTIRELCGEEKECEN